MCSVRRSLSRWHHLGLYQRPAHQRDRRHHDAVYLPDDGRNIQPHDPGDDASGRIDSILATGRQGSRTIGAEGAHSEPWRNASRTKDRCCGPGDFSSGRSASATFAPARNAPAAATGAAPCSEASYETRAGSRGQAGGKLDAVNEANLRTDDNYSTLISSRR